MCRWASQMPKTMSIWDRVYQFWVDHCQCPPLYIIKIHLVIYLRLYEHKRLTRASSFNLIWFIGYSLVITSTKNIICYGLCYYAVIGKLCLFHKWTEGGYRSSSKLILIWFYMSLYENVNNRLISGPWMKCLCSGCRLNVSE